MNHSNKKTELDRREMNPMRFLLFLLIGITVFLSGVFVGKVEIKKQKEEGVDYKLTGDFYNKANEVNINILWDAWDQLESIYIKKDLSGEDLLNGTVKGLVDSLGDPYTFFLTKEETAEYQNGNASAFEGIGTTLRYNGEHTVIESPIDGYPARKAGLEPGDVILEVDGEDMRNKSATHVAAKIRGEAGTTVKLAIFKVSKQEEQKLDIVREKIDLDNVTYEDLGDGIVKIKIIKFTEETVSAFNQQWDATMQNVLSKNPRGIVIDIRNNPGGFVDSAKYASSEFLDKGKVILIEEDRDGRRNTHKVERTGLMRNIPVVVLVNKGSASASEIFAGALQDHGRAKVVGEKTVGKGVEQRVVNLSGGASMHVVFRRWLTPNGRNINQEDPITPDFKIEYKIEEFNKGLDPQLEKAVELLK
ncbi:S41 family peptidase [Candidatus Dojkabacteria bacterium]|nr:S41 family peptidase [Candidatus Dojkabacteria bacterium]